MITTWLNHQMADWYLSNARLHRYALTTLDSLDTDAYYVHRSHLEASDLAVS